MEKDKQHINIIGSDTFKKITNGMSNLQKIGIQIAKVLEPAAQLGKVIQGIMNHIAETIDLKTVSESMAKIGKLIAGFAKVVDLFSFIMIEIDWPPPLEIQPKHMLDIIEIYQNKGVLEAKKYTGNLLIKLYDKEMLIRLLKSWKSKEWLSKRTSILENVINAHIEGKYILSIPAMFPQIEGIIVDGYGHTGWFDEKKLKKYINKLYKDDGKSFSVDEVISTFLLGTVWAKFQHGTKASSSLSRHAILHGADVTYGTAENSLKTILLFNYLQKSFKLISIIGSNKFHKIGCNYILRSKKEKKFYESENEAKKDGKTICKICSRL